jgi:uncharacterized protein YihD (DUF1040 family)
MSKHVLEGQTIADIMTGQQIPLVLYADDHASTPHTHDFNPDTRELLFRYPRLGADSHLPQGLGVDGNQMAGGNETGPHDQQRIKRILATIEQIWLREPDLRLGQLLTNVIGEYDTGLYYVRDDALEADINRALARLTEGIQ